MALTPAQQLAGFIGKFAPRNQALIRALPARGKGRLILRSVSKKQRPRQAVPKSS
jgi:hypothetical protein